MLSTMISLTEQLRVIIRVDRFNSYIFWRPGHDDTRNSFYTKVNQVTGNYHLWAKISALLYREWRVTCTESSNTNRFETAVWRLQIVSFWTLFFCKLFFCIRTNWKLREALWRFPPRTHGSDQINIYLLHCIGTWLSKRVRDETGLRNFERRWCKTLRIAEAL